MGFGDCVGATGGGYGAAILLAGGGLGTAVRKKIFAFGAGTYPGGGPGGGVGINLAPAALGGVVGAIDPALLGGVFGAALSVTCQSRSHLSFCPLDLLLE